MEQVARENCSQCMTDSKIEWTGPTWNILAGCSPQSPGCLNCYATSDVHRFREHYSGKPGLVTLNTNPLKPGLTFLPVDPKTGKSLGKGAKWTGAIRCMPHKLADPLGRAKPTTWFANSISDIFHEVLVDSDFGRRFIAAAFGIMVVAQHHTFQLLTKQPAKGVEWMAWARASADERGLSIAEFCVRTAQAELVAAAERCGPEHRDEAEALREQADDVWMRWLVAIASERGDVDSYRNGAATIAKQVRRALRHHAGDVAPHVWPRPNIHIGTSVEDAARKPRVEQLRRIDAALRFISFEPLLEDLGALDLAGIAWAIGGGESGAKARACYVEWLRALELACRASGTALFVKQLGAVPMTKDYESWPTGTMLGSGRAHLNNVKGGDMQEWPRDLRIRMMPGDRWDDLRWDEELAAWAC